MIRTLDPQAYDDAILASTDDFEPYGFAEPRLVPVSSALPRPAAEAHRQDRVIEAALLHRLSAPDW